MKFAKFNLVLAVIGVVLNLFGIFDPSTVVPTEANVIALILCLVFAIYYTKEIKRNGEHN